MDNTKPRSKGTALYHRVRVHENLQHAAQTLLDLIADAQEASPGKKRYLCLDIDGHRTATGAFDADMFDLQAFIVDKLVPFLTEAHCPLGSWSNSEQQNEVPTSVIVVEPEEG